MNSVVSQVLLDLDMLIEEMEALVTVDSLPTITGDATQLKQLFQNLLGNALKFRQSGVPPQIRVSSLKIAASSLPPDAELARPAQAYYRVDVTDNGVVFEQKYADRLFQVFQRPLPGHAQCNSQPGTAKHKKASR